MWTELINELLESGLSEQKIADRIGTSQATVNRIKLGRRKRVQHETGQALIALQNWVRTQNRKSIAP